MEDNWECLINEFIGLFFKRISKILRAKKNVSLKIYFVQNEVVTIKFILFDHFYHEYEFTSIFPYFGSFKELCTLRTISRFIDKNFDVTEIKIGAMETIVDHSFLYIKIGDKKVEHSIEDSF
jgi:hypothetical protein